MKDFAYHQWSGADLRRHFNVDLKEGLSKKEAALRLEKNGLNSFAEEKESGFFSIFIRQFTNFFIVLLILAAIISAVTEGFASSIIFIVIIILNIGIGFFQEYKAERSLSALKKTIVSEAKVIRDGEIITIDSEKLVLGDLVIISEGDKIPADIRIIEENSLRVNESSLTGESMPISKHEVVLPIDTPLAERLNMAYMGTVAVAGSGRGIVTATGALTEIGKVANLIEKTEEKTPLEEKILYIGKIISYVAISIALTVFALGLLQGWQPMELVAYVIALIVAAVPESLPTVVTLTLAIGMINMVKKNAVVRRMGVVEALGSVNIILTDKTGTLTKNELKVAKYGFIKNGETVIYDGDLPHSKIDKELLYFATICSDAKGEKAKEIVGDPLEAAIIRKLIETNHEGFVRAKKFERLTGMAFDSDKKYMVVDGKIGDERYIVIKGAVEAVMPFLKLSEKEKSLLHDLNLELSDMGMKNIAVLKKKIAGKNLGTLKNLELVGVIGFSDEPAEDVEASLAAAKRAGIRPIILTGDHPNTAKYIAESVGMPVTDSEILTGSEISSLSDKALTLRLPKVKIFARATPADKIRIVELFEKAGFIVAVTGDGVNDAPALKAATVGIAMGVRGNDVSREAADIILSDDSYKTIIHAISYGRQIYNNVKNALTFLLSTNMVEITIIALSFLFALPAPLTAVQILWINLITDSLPAIALAFEKPTAGLLSEMPKSDTKADIKRSLKLALAIGLYSLVILIIIYIFGLNQSITEARTLVFATIIFSQMLIILSIRSKQRIWENFPAFFGNNYLNYAVIFSLILQTVIFLPQTRKFFGLSVINSTDILIILIASLSIFFGVEFIKKRHDKKSKVLESNISCAAISKRGWQPKQSN